MIHASYLSHISEDVIIAPKSKLNDGVIWLLVIKNGISRTTFLQVSESLLNNIFENIFNNSPCLKTLTLRLYLQTL